MPGKGARDASLPSRQPKTALPLPQHEVDWRGGFDTGTPGWRSFGAMLRRCGTWFVVLALVLATGGHWAVLQVCAWSGMVVRFAQDGSVREALSKTFDGRHPCRLCKLVREGRAAQRSKAAPLAVTKLDLLAPDCASPVALRPELGRAAAFRLPARPPLRRLPPPVPPPRVA